MELYCWAEDAEMEKDRRRSTGMISLEERMQLVTLLRQAETLGIRQTKKLEFVENDTSMDAIAAMYYAATEQVPYKFNDLPDDFLIEQFADMAGIDLKQEYGKGQRLYYWLLRIQDIHHWTFAQICAELEQA
jgi:hypothetical protein